MSLSSIDTQIWKMDDRGSHFRSLRLNDTPDGPRPRNKQKPGKVNAADQFYRDHQAQYDKRAACEPPADVQQYNEVPRLKEQVARRADIKNVRALSAKQTPNQLKNNVDYEPKCNCRKCKRRLQYTEARQSYKRSRSRSPLKRPSMNSRVDKSALRSKTRLNKRNPRYKLLNRSTCTSLIIKEEASTITAVLDTAKVVLDNNNVTEKENKVKAKRIRDSNTNSFHSVGTTLPSNTSQMSLDHEPMVTDTPTDNLNLGNN